MPRPAATLATISIAYLLLVLAVFVGCSDQASNRPDVFPQTHRPERAASISPARCASCHQKEVEDWQASHHAHANRVLTEDDRQTLELANEFDASGTVSTSKLPTSADSPHKVAGVLAYDPFHQFLVASDDGRFQAHSTAYNPHTNEWFEVFAEQRQEGEWGHWTGQGMNWNSNCAWCHMTEFEAGYDIPTDTYQSTWTAQGISCVQCHSQAEEHAEAAEAGRNPISADSKKGSNAVSKLHNCAGCHSRRSVLTGSEFKAGENYHDHFQLTLPEHEGLYFPDLQANDEVFVYASLQLSPMGHAGVSCLDCHNPHSGGLVVPAQNNALCLQCHSGAQAEAPVINPSLHSRHPIGSNGNSCIECHMPERTYMQADPRRDHGFTIPDPILSQELGTPNACLNCHQEEGLEWVSASWADWYGSPKNDQRRTRARMLDQAFDPNQELPVQSLSGALNSEENPYLIATYLKLAANKGTLPSELSLDEATLVNHPEAIVRSALAYLFANDPSKLAELGKLSLDHVRSVRIQAIDSFLRLNPQVPLKSNEYQEMILSNADRPRERLILATQAIQAGDLDAAFNHAKTAVSFDKNNSQLVFQAAVTLASGGQIESAQSLLANANTAAREDGLVDYGEGLLWAEKGLTSKAIESLNKAVSKNPQQERWWYNLVSAYLEQSNTLDARSTLKRAQSHLPESELLNNLWRYLPQN